MSAVESKGAVNAVGWKTPAILGPLLVPCLALVWPDDGPLTRWAHAQDNEADVLKLSATMQRLADEGKRDAIIWVARNVPAEDHGRLAALAATGDGEALALEAQRLWDTDRVQAEKVAKASADTGYLPAVKWSLSVPRHKVATWE